MVSPFSETCHVVRCGICWRKNLQQLRCHWNGSESDYSKWNILCESLSRQETKNSTVSAFEEGGGVLLQVPVRQWNTILVGRLEWNIPEFYSFIRRQNTAERFITLWGRVKRLWKVTAGIISFKVSWGPGGCHTYMHSGLSVIWRRIWWQLVGWLVIVSPIWSNDTHTVLLALMSFFFPFS